MDEPRGSWLWLPALISANCCACCSCSAPAAGPNPLTDSPTGWLTDKPTDWLIDCGTAGLTDWLSRCLVDWLMLILEIACHWLWPPIDLELPAMVGFMLSAYRTLWQFQFTVSSLIMRFRLFICPSLSWPAAVCRTLSGCRSLPLGHVLLAYLIERCPGISFILCYARNAFDLFCSNKRGAPPL